MGTKRSLLTFTSPEFSDFIFEKLGKGRQHALLIYEEFFRKGKIQGLDPAFNNAGQLYKSILDLIDSNTPFLHLQKEDGATKKILLKTHDNLEIESVLVPMQAGGTLCISSQVGCKMGCTFCETGRMGLLRNLTVEEIVSQLFIAKFILNFEVRNLVFMGMGEPFDNYDAVMQAARVFMDSKGFGLGRSHITVSTSGCVDAIYKFTAEKGPKPNLAVSINAPGNEIRKRLMPVNNKFDMQALYQAMLNYNNETQLEILTAYVLLKDLNDSLEHANELAAYLKGLKVKINLIPYNAQSKDRFAPSDETTINAFRQRLQEHGYQTLLRVTKGKDIMAACGQLGNLNLRKELYQKRKE